MNKNSVTSFQLKKKKRVGMEQNHQFESLVPDSELLNSWKNSNTLCLFPHVCGGSRFSVTPEIPSYTDQDAQRLGTE